jgi:2,3,4,5-tetrahydropyridine-2-carboxylate N-succinyltransferase
VIEPIGALPVIIEDDVFVGGNCGIYEGCLIRQGAVLASGVILTGSSRVYDVPNERILMREPGGPLEIPENAVVVPGSRPVDTPFGRTHGLALQTPIIVKYRDARTDAATTLEEALR